MELVRILVVVHVQTRDPKSQRGKQQTVDGEVY